MPIKDEYLTKEIRYLSNRMAEIMKPNDIEYVETVLGVDYEEALKSYPLELFLMLLEVFIGNYVQQMLMIHATISYLKKIKLKEINLKALILGSPKEEYYINFNKFSSSNNLVEIYNIYNMLFLGEGREVLQELIEKVDNPLLRQRFKKFFLGDEL